MKMLNEIYGDVRGLLEACWLVHTRDLQDSRQIVIPFIGEKIVVTFTREDDEP